MKHEYHEGPEVADKFEDTMRKLFQVPKCSVKPPVITKRIPKETSKG
jgi:hypothetical protein